MRAGRNGGHYTSRGPRRPYEASWRDELPPGALLLVGAVAALLAGIVGGDYYLAAYPQRHETCTVTDKYVIASEKHGNSYRVNTEECGALKVGNFVTAGRFDQATVYADIKPGKTYDMELRGHRIGILSMFPSIGDYKEVQG